MEKMRCFSCCGGYGSVWCICQIEHSAIFKNQNFIMHKYPLHIFPHFSSCRDFPSFQICTICNYFTKKIMSFFIHVVKINFLHSYCKSRTEKTSIHSSRPALHAPVCFMDLTIVPRSDQIQLFRQNPFCDDMESRKLQYCQNECNCHSRMSQTKGAVRSLKVHAIICYNLS